MKLSAGALAAFIICSATTAACDKMAKEIFTPPSVTFQGVRMGSLSLNGSRLYIQLGVRNPNRFALSANHAEYKLMVDDSIVVGDGQTNDTLSVPPHDSASITLPLDVAWGDLTRAGGGALAAGEVNYRVVGKISANTPIGPHDIPLDGKGRFNPLQRKR